MKYYAVLPLLLAISCTKEPEPDSTITVKCVEKGVHPFFVNKAIDKYTLVTYENNNSFDKVISTEERYTNEDSIENGKYMPLLSKYRYDVQVNGYDTFRISGFVNTPTTATVYKSHHGYYNNCFYNNEIAIVNGDSIKPQAAQFYDKLVVDKK